MGDGVALLNAMLVKGWDEGDVMWTADLAISMLAAVGVAGVAGLALVDVTTDFVVVFVCIASLVANRARELPEVAGDVALVAVAVVRTAERESMVEVGL
jgi:hypothetical protein